MSQEEVLIQDVMDSIISTDKDPIHNPVHGVQGVEEKEEVSSESRPKEASGSDGGQQEVDIECSGSGSGDEHQQQQRELHGSGEQSNGISKSPKLQHDG